MSTLTKYILLQIPGWLIMALVAIGLHRWIDLPLWAAIGLFVLWVVKDFLLYPFLRKSYESNTKTGSTQLVGARGVAQERLDPQGYVHVHGELWRAEVESKDRPIASGSRVRVCAAHGLTLIVTADEEHAHNADENHVNNSVKGET